MPCKQSSASGSVSSRESFQTSAGKLTFWGFGYHMGFFLPLLRVHSELA